jgi:hypothetical protein
VAGVDPLGVVDAVDFDVEPVAAGVDPPGDRRLTGGSEGPVPVGFPTVAGGAPVEAALFVAMRPGEPFELGQIGLDAGLFDDERVAGGERLDLGEGQDGLADVVELAAGDLAAHDLVDEPGLPFDALPSPNFESAVNSMDETARAMPGSGRGT